MRSVYSRVAPYVEYKGPSVVAGLNTVGMLIEELDPWLSGFQAYLEKSKGCWPVVKKGLVLV